MKESTISLKGMRYRYLTLGKGRKTLVILHGITADKNSMAHFFEIDPHEPLLKKYRCIIPDLPGHNYIPRYGEGTVDDYADYIIALIEHLKIKNFALIGYSFGSLVALKIEEKSERKIPLVLWASPIAGLSPVIKISLPLINSMPNWLYMIIATVPLLLPGRLLIPKEIRASIDSARNFDNKMILYACFGADRQSLDSPNPKLFIFGTKDHLVSKNAAQRLLKMRPNNTRIITVEQGGHFGTDKGIRKALRFIRAFIYKNL